MTTFEMLYGYEPMRADAHYRLRMFEVEIANQQLLAYLSDGAGPFTSAPAATPCKWCGTTGKGRCESCGAPR